MLAQAAAQSAMQGLHNTGILQRPPHTSLFALNKPSSYTNRPVLASIMAPFCNFGEW